MQIEQIDISKITVYENNAKLHPAEQIEQIKKSIEEFGNNDPIAIDENNMIIEGHGRYYALKELGYKEVPVIRLSHLDEEKKKAYILVHNKLTMNSDFDFDTLQEELNNIELDMEQFGFSNFDIDMNFEEEKERKDLSNTEFEKYEVIISCNNEFELEETYNKLLEEGYECRISTL